MPLPDHAVPRLPLGLSENNLAGLCKELLARLRGRVYRYDWAIAAAVIVAAGVLALVALWPRSGPAGPAAAAIPAAELESAQDRWVLVFVSGAVLGSVAAGVLAGVLLDPLAPWLGLAGLAAVVVAVLRRGRGWLLMLLLLAGFLLGAARGALSPAVSLPPGIAGQRAALEGRVDDDPVRRGRSLRITVAVDRVSLRGGSRPVRLRLIASLRGAAPVEAGSRVLLTGQIRRPSRFEQFDYRTFLAD